MSMTLISGLVVKRYLLIPNLFGQFSSLTTIFRDIHVNSSGQLLNGYHLFSACFSGCFHSYLMVAKGGHSLSVAQHLSKHSRQ